jgi:hypothetical protein
MAAVRSAGRPSQPVEDGEDVLLRRLAQVQADNARLMRDVAQLEHTHDRDAGALEHMTLAVRALRAGVVALRADNAELRGALSALHTGHDAPGAARA